MININITYMQVYNDSEAFITILHYTKISIITEYNAESCYLASLTESSLAVKITN